MTRPHSVLSHGGYKNLLSLHTARIVYDSTCRFCEKFSTFGDRTIDLRIHAAWSGNQNIQEGFQACGTSKETEIKLINVAHASQEELLEYYRDYLRTRRFDLWPKDPERPYS